MGAYKHEKVVVIQIDSYIIGAYYERIKVADNLLAEVNENINLGYSQAQGYS